MTLPDPIKAVLENLSDAVRFHNAIAVPIEEAARRLGCRKSRVHQLLSIGKLQSTKLGRKVLIYSDSIEALVPSGLPAESQMKRARVKKAAVDPNKLAAQISKLQPR